MFTPPGNHILYRYSQRLYARGIEQYWDTEYLAMYAGHRVQERSRVISPTKMVYDFGHDVIALQLEGNIAAMFFSVGDGIACLFSLLHQ